MFTINQSIEATEETALCIYNKIRRTQLLDEAKAALYRAVAYDKRENPEQEIRDIYGVNMFLACYSGSPQNLLEAIVDRYDELTNSQQTPDDVFDCATKRVLMELSDRITTGLVPFIPRKEKWKGISVSTITLKNLEIEPTGIIRCRENILETTLTPQVENWYERSLPLDMSCFSEEDTLRVIAKFHMYAPAVEIYLQYRADRDTELVPFDLSEDDQKELYSWFNRNCMRLHLCDFGSYYKTHEEKPTFIPIVDNSNGREDIFLLQFNNTVSSAQAKRIVEDARRIYGNMEDEPNASFRTMMFDEKAPEILAQFGAKIVNCKETIFLND